MPLNTLIQGSGKPVVLLHGFCEDLTIWSGLQTKLAHAYQVISIDLPGFGSSTSTSQGFTLNDVADEIMRVPGLCGPEPFPVIGHSLGGYVALAMAENYYDRIAGLGLFHSTSYADSMEKKQNRERTMEFILDKGAAPFIKTFVPGLFYAENIRDHTAEINALINSGLQVDTNVIIDYTKAMRDRADRSKLHFNFDKHRLFIGGAKDPAIAYKDFLSQFINLEGETTVILE